MECAGTVGSIGLEELSPAVAVVGGTMVGDSAGECECEVYGSEHRPYRHPTYGKQEDRPADISFTFFHLYVNADALSQGAG